MLTGSTWTARVSVMALVIEYLVFRDSTHEQFIGETVRENIPVVYAEAAVTVISQGTGPLPAVRTFSDIQPEPRNRCALLAWLERCQLASSAVLVIVGVAESFCAHSPVTGTETADSIV